MLSLLGISFALAAAAGAAAEAKPLDPKVEALLTFVTDSKSLGKLRGAEVIARFRGIVPLKETEKLDYRWEFEGRPAQGPIAMALIQFEEGPRLKTALFRLRTDALMQLQTVLAGRLRSKLGKPKVEYKNEAAQVAYWDIGKEWIVGVSAQKAVGLDLKVTEWYDEPEEWEP
jgi:hypothetical protein